MEPICTAVIIGGWSQVSDNLKCHSGKLKDAASCLASSAPPSEPKHTPELTRVFIPSIQGMLQVSDFISCTFSVSAAGRIQLKLFP
jgi:hypothetical protein